MLKKLQHSHFIKVNSNDVDHSENIVIMNSNDTRLSMEFHITSPDFTQNPTYTNHCICICCHKPDLPRSQCIIFKASRYNSDNSVISHALSNHFLVSAEKEFICKKCDKSLLAEKMPVDVADTRCRLQNSKQKICLYCKGTSTKSILFDITAYGNNLLAIQIHENGMLHHNSVICEKCYNTNLQESLLTCIICEKTDAKKCLIVYATFVTYNYNKVLYVCVAAGILRKVCVNIIGKLTMAFQPLLYHDAYHM